MERQELLKTREYWTEKIKLDLFQIVSTYRKENNLTIEKLATKLGVTKGYVSQVLNGDFDHKISKLVELAMACDVVPIIKFEPIMQYIQDDEDDNCDGYYKDRPIINIDFNFSNSKKELTNNSTKIEEDAVY